jgi:hypothetical protein
MNDELTHMEWAFVDSYGSNVADVPRERVIQFLQMQKAGVSSREIHEELPYGDYTSLADAWGVWRDGINYARSAK